MANVLIFNIVLVLVTSCADSCSIPSFLYVSVPQTILAGHQITKVEIADCDIKSMDSSFTINSRGEIVASTPVSVENGGRTFSVSAQDSSGLKSEMKVHLVRDRMPEVQHTGQGYLKRFKRRWSPPPFNILENDKGPYPKEIEKIVSDSSAVRNVYYTFTGPGFNEHPVGVFSLDRLTGMLSVLKEIDREEFPSFKLITNVFDINTHQLTDLPLPITIDIDDVNDNAPTFKGPQQYTVLEQSKPGTVVGKVNATDRDQANTLHVKIKYTLLTGLDLFAINPETGVITTITNTLDREVKDKHLVTVQIKDMDGRADGLSNTATATITVGDINDNPPTFTKTSYQATVQENANEKQVLRIPVEDKDLINTPNWKSKFVVTKGNEKGNFRVDTDPKTNEGLLYVSKSLDYEQSKNVKLEIQARNEAKLSGSSAQWQSIPVDLTVTNVDEGPEFIAPTIHFTVKENTLNGTVIGSYTAVDPETKSSNGINYYKTTDPASWINVDRSTGELRVANTIDRESHFVQNGIYNITMKAVDASSKTGTGTVIISVEDVNDNIPVLPSKELVLCEREGELGSVLVVPEDKDQTPFSSPFTFSFPDDHDGKWALINSNATTTTLKHMKELPRGIYNVRIAIKDLQGNGGVQVAKVRICQCTNGACMAAESTVSLGPLALLTMLLPLALLLLLCALLAFFCVTKEKKIPIEDVGDSGGNLLKSNTEALGDEVDSSLIHFPPIGAEQTVKGSVKDSTLNEGWRGKSTSTMGTITTKDQGIFSAVDTTTTNGAIFNGFETQYGNHYDTQHFNGGSGRLFDNRYLTQDSSFLHTWQTNGRYLHQKLGYLGTEDGRYADDIIHSYKFEGVGSAAGSVGCCSECDDNDNLDFLSTLGPKFKTLADVCTKT